MANLLYSYAKSISLLHPELTSSRDCPFMHPGKRVKSLIKMHAIGDCIQCKTFAENMVLTSLFNKKCTENCNNNWKDSIAFPGMLSNHSFK